MFVAADKLPVLAKALTKVGRGQGAGGRGQGRTWLLRAAAGQPG